MKKIGILGGMSAASTQLYYKALCDLTLEKFGGLTSPNLLVRSVDFAPLAAHMEAGRWDEIGAILNNEAKMLEAGGAEMLVLATNTMHKLAPQMMAGVTLPMLHIADATADAVLAGNCQRPIFLATKFTMQERFYLDKLEEKGLSPIVPNSEQRETINKIIFEELCRNEVIPASQQAYIDIVNDLKTQGADSVILGCTEICLLLNADNTGLPAFDTTEIHCRAVLDAACA